MASQFKKLVERQLITDAPSFLKNASQYEVIMGSVAYGVNHDQSDIDIYGFAIPPKHIMFAHQRGEIPDFDPCEIIFRQYQKHHIFDQQALAGKGQTYDITLYSIARFFRLLTDNNPNIIDMLYVPQHCILHATPIAQMIREKRHIFLHKGCWHKFKGYAYGQIHKMRTKQPIGNRKAIIDEFGYDVKFAYHVVRLLGEVEQLMVEQDLDLSRNAEMLNSIRAGEWSQIKLEHYFNDKEKQLESAFTKCQLPDAPNTIKIRQLLCRCLEQHFGSLSEIITQPNTTQIALNQIKKIIDDLA